METHIDRSNDRSSAQRRRAHNPTPSSSLAITWLASSLTPPHQGLGGWAQKTKREVCCMRDRGLLIREHRGEVKRDDERDEE